MIVYARFLSPYGRRIMVWLALQNRPFTHQPLSPMDDFAALQRLNPVGRAPVLELEDGTRLVESFAIMDYLETTATPEARLMPMENPARRDAFQRLAHGHAAAEKAVALVYDKNRRPPEFHWPAWQERLAGQIQGVVGAIEAALPAEGYWGGDRPMGPDIAAVIAYDFIETTNPALLEPGYPKLRALSARANALAAFETTHPRLT